MSNGVKRPVLVLDLCANGGLLLFLLVFPVFFLVPYVDDWMRFRGVEARGVCSWVFAHARDWVVRPLADLLLATLASLVSRTGGHELNATRLLAAFHAGYFVSIGIFALLVYAQARALFQRSVAGLSLLCCLWLIVLFASDEVGYAFFWVDGYANFVFPFLLLTIGMALVFRRGARMYIGALCLLLGALGHEIICLFTLGFSALTLTVRRGALDIRQKRCFGLLLVTLTSLLCVQVFSPGPRHRALVYAKRTGTRFNVDGALDAIAQIDGSMCLLSFLATLCALAIYEDALADCFDALRDDARKHRWYWCLLCFGAASMIAVPYASVGLTKHTLMVSLYGAATMLFTVLTAVISYVLLSPFVERPFRSYRTAVGSILPAVIVVVCLTPNPELFRDAWRRLPELTRQAERYVKTLKQAPLFASVCRPAHPFALAPRRETGREAAAYFGIAKVHEERCPR